MHRHLFTAVALLGLLPGIGAGPGRAAEVVFVRDLSAVAGCRFLGTLAPPRAVLGSRRPDDYAAYERLLGGAAEARGATHLYVLNPSAGWGGAAAVGTAYACLY